MHPLPTLGRGTPKATGPSSPSPVAGLRPLGEAVREEGMGEHTGPLPFVLSPSETQRRAEQWQAFLQKEKSVFFPPTLYSYSKHSYSCL